MDLTKVLGILSTHAKAATIAGVAVAATAGGGAVVATTVADSTPTTTTVTTQTGTNAGDGTEAPDVKDTESPDAQDTQDSQSTPDAGKTVTPVDCGTTTWANHGAFVRSVAQSTPDPTASPNAHGMAVSAAAQSDCGKPTPGASSTDSPQGTSQRNSNATTHQGATHGKSAAHRHHH